MRIPEIVKEQAGDVKWPEVNFWEGRKLLLATESTWNGTHYVPKEEFPSEILYSASAVFMVLAVLGIVGNMLAHFALTKDNKLKYFTSTLIINLITADLLISCLYSFMIALVMIRSKGHYSEENCRVFAYVKYSASMICMFIIVALILNRCVSVVYPKIYNIVYRRRNIWIMIAAIWLVPMVLLLFPVGEVGGRLGYDAESGSCEILDETSLRNFSCFLIFIASPAIIISCYCVICFVTVARRKGWTWCSCLQNDDSTAQGTEGRKVNKNKDPSHDGNDFRLLCFIFLFFVITFICYIPLFFVKIVRSEESYYWKHVLCYVPYFFASSVKPFIYFAMCQNYRDKYKSLFIRRRNYF